ncbi:hypothetical protein H2201_009265, partial [Coniosporium apollinis]
MESNMCVKESYPIAQTLVDNGEITGLLPSEARGDHINPPATDAIRACNESSSAGSVIGEEPASLASLDGDIAVEISPGRNGLQQEDAQTADYNNVGEGSDTIPTIAASAPASASAAESDQRHPGAAEDLDLEIAPKLMFPSRAIRHTFEAAEEIGSEISSSEVECAVEYFTVINNTSPAYFIELQGSWSRAWHSPKPWDSLQTLESVRWNGTVYRIGDVVYIREDDESDPIAVAEIAEIRSLDDTRSALRVFWFYSRHTVEGKLCRNDLRAWPKGRMHIKSTHMDVVMWDCATGKLSEADMQHIWEGKVLDMWAKAWRVRDEDSSR